jgi:MinD superfamily P-loop ATPase
MKEIVVLSGKGGTGKTSITASFAVLSRMDVVVADCDVDAADMHLLMQPDFGISEDFFSGEVAYIEQNNCIHCGKCAEICRFDAVSIIKKQFVVDPQACDGCGYCARICPTKTIINRKRQAGKWFISTIKTGSIMVHARLGIGADNSGKLVAKVKNEAKDIAQEERKSFVLVDGSPGIGCPVVSSLSGASFVVLVTEPSVSGLHDLSRVHKLISNFNVPSGCIINKADINPEKRIEIIRFLQENNIVHIADLPYDESFTKAMVKGQTIVEYDHGKLNELLNESWKKVKQLVKI